MPSLYPGLLAAWYGSFLLPLQNGSQGLAKDTSWDLLWEHNSWSAKQENMSRDLLVVCFSLDGSRWKFAHLDMEEKTAEMPILVLPFGLVAVVSD